MNLHLRQTDVAVGFAHRAGHRKLIEADRTVDLVHIELGLFEGAQFHAGPFRYIDDAAHAHRLHRVRPHRAALANLDAPGILFLHQFDQRLEHARVRGESGIRRHRYYGIDLDQHLVALVDDVTHPAHRLIGDLANHRLYEIELLSCILRRLTQVSIAVRDRDQSFSFPLFFPRESASVARALESKHLNIVVSKPTESGAGR